MTESSADASDEPDEDLDPGIRSLPLAPEVHGVDPSRLPRDVPLAQKEFRQLVLATKGLLESLELQSHSEDDDGAAGLTTFSIAMRDDSVQSHLAEGVSLHDLQQRPVVDAEDEPSMQEEEAQSTWD